MFRRTFSASRAALQGPTGRLTPSWRLACSSCHSLSLATMARQRRCGASCVPCAAVFLSGSQRRHFSLFPSSRKKVAAAATPAEEKSSPPAAAAAAAAPSAAASAHAEEQSGLEDDLSDLRQQYLEPYDKVYRFVSPLRKTAPMVMMLGNHSSGKSTLINYLVGREIQETGIAPTDDGFTVIRRDSFDLDTDGPSVVSNPKYQYQSLQQFGFSFVRHFKMKTRKMAETSPIPMDMVLVDTPGMIDTPLHASLAGSAAKFSAAEAIFGSDQTRGYDFLGVTRWFAQQSDVILLMFDPANPGTTGETLDVLTKSLAGYEHKFLLLLNKADSFEKVTDFGRAYGTLCWNLSKVMKMKDVPRVYTTCTPLGKQSEAGKTRSTGTVPDAELARQRTEIMKEITAAPIRRMDNLITETEDSARNLLLAVRAAKVLRQDYRQRQVLVYSGVATAFLIGPAIAVVFSSISLAGTVLLSLLSIAVSCGGVVAARAYLKEFEQDLLRSCDYILNRIFTSKNQTRDVDLRWHRIVKPEIKRVASTATDNGASGILGLPTCSASACRGMERVINEEIPSLRRYINDYKESYLRGRSKTAKP